eukprot:m.64729 g.64729  ORF g.64729 m.64729 type:complete len:71 (-) comp7537_c0_seq2:1392-1604(-)
MPVALRLSITGTVEVSGRSTPSGEEITVENDDDVPVESIPHEEAPDDSLCETSSPTAGEFETISLEDAEA